MSVTQLGHDRSHGAAGVALAVLSAAGFSTSGTFADALMRTGWTPGAVVSFRIGLAALALTPPALVALRGRWPLLRAAAAEVLAFGLVAVAGSQLFFFSAVQHLPVGVALLLEYGGILLVVLWTWLRRGQRPGRLTVTGGLLAVVGLALVLQPGSGGVSAAGVAWGALAAVGLAVYFLLSARGGSALPSIALAWAGMVVGAAVLALSDLTHVLAFRTRTADVLLAHHRVSWVVPVLGLAVVAAAAAYALGILAARLLGARLASFVGLTEVLFAVLVAWAALGQAPRAGQLLGGVGVLAGVALVRAGEPAVAASREPAAAPVGTGRPG